MKDFRSSEKNKKILEDLYTRLNPGTVKAITVTVSDLQSMGWEGRMPTKVFLRFDNYWIRELYSYRYSIVKVEPYMLKAKAPEVSANEPLPINIDPSKRISPRDMLKKQIKEDGK